jgi:hypothetical protein
LVFTIPHPSKLKFNLPGILGPGFGYIIGTTAPSLMKIIDYERAVGVLIELGNEGLLLVYLLGYVAIPAAKKIVTRNIFIVQKK